MKKTKESQQKNTKIAIIFFIFLALIVAVSLVFKLILVVRDGKFDDSKRFTVSISNNKNLEVISLSPSVKSIAVFKLDKEIKPQTAGKFLEVPIDGFILEDSLDLNQKINSLFFTAVLNYNSLQTNMTIIDLLKLLFFTKDIGETKTITKNIAIDLNPADMDKIVGQLVSDELIEKDNQTIQIINGTSIGGLGNRLARLVTNMGGDVIIVATSDSPKKKSVISYIDKKTYTVERLSKVLKYEVAKSAEFVISDITIIIGEDRVRDLVF